MADFDTELDLFSFIPAEPVPEPPPPPRPARRKPAHRELQQLCFGFLWSLNPDAAAMRVPARFHKYQVTAAGFWRGETGRNRSVERTAVVVLYERFEHCFADCADRDARLAAIHELRAEKEALEAEIRRTEPELGSTDDLFSDFRVWNYAASRNRDYLKLRRRLEKLQHALHQGSRLEHIRHTGVADYCYLAVPENLVAPDEIAAGWGLVYLPEGCPGPKTEKLVLRLMNLRNTAPEPAGTGSDERGEFPPCSRPVWAAREGAPYGYFSGVFSPQKGG